MDERHCSVDAAVQLASSYREALLKFSDHLLVLEDIFFFEDRRHEDLFVYCIRHLNPLLPLSSLEQEAAKSRFVHLLKAFEETVQTELRSFYEESEAVRTMYRDLIAKEQQRWAHAEMARQDEFIALSQLCRREVAAVVAHVKAVALQTTTELDAFHALQETLEAKQAEIDALRKSASSLVKAHENERRQWLDDVSRERDAARSLILADRAQVTAQLQQQVSIAEDERFRLHDEMLHMETKHVQQLDSLRHRLQQQQEEQEALRGKLDQASLEHSKSLREAADEKNTLLKKITDLEIRCETLKRESQEARNEARLQQLDHEQATETRKMLEIQSFKRKLADTTAMLCNSTISGSTPAHAPLSARNGSVPFSSNNDRCSRSSTIHADIANSPPSYRELSYNSVLKSAASPVTSSRAKSPSTTASTIQVRSPSDTFLRLANITRGQAESLSAPILRHVI